MTQVILPNLVFLTSNIYQGSLPDILKLRDLIWCPDVSEWFSDIKNIIKHAFVVGLFW